MSVRRETPGEARAFGEEIARLRTKRGWSRPALLRQIDRALGDADAAYEPRSEAWLHRLENGQIVKLPRPIINAISRALQCTPREHARLLLLADRNVLWDSSDTNDLMDLFNYMMVSLYDETYAFLSYMTRHYDIAGYSEEEKEELFLTALELVIEQRRDETQDALHPNPRTAHEL